MTPLQRLTICIVTILSLTACTGGDKATIAMLDRAEAYLPQHPDSAALLLDSIDTSCRALSSQIHKGQLRNRSNQEAKRGKETGEWFPLYSLLRTMTDDMLHGITPNDSIIRHTYIYYKEQMDGKLFFLQSNTLKRRYARSAFYLAKLETMYDSVKRAEDLYNEAINYSQKVEDWRTCYMSYCYLATLSVWHDEHISIQLLDQALNYYKQVNDKIENLCFIYQELGRNYIIIGDTVCAFRYLNMSYNLACSNNFVSRQGEVMRLYASAYNDLGQNEKALYYAKRGMNEVESDVLFNAKYLLSSCYEECDSLQQARDILLSMIDEPLTRNRYFLFKSLSRISSKLQDFEAAQVYDDSTNATSERMYVDVMHENAEYASDISTERTQIEILTLKTIVYIIFFIICTCVLIFFTVYLQRKLKLHKAARSKFINASRKYFMQQRKEYEDNLALRDSIVKSKVEEVERMQEYNIKQSPVYIKISSNQVNILSLKDEDLNLMKQTLDNYSNLFATRIAQAFPEISTENLILLMLIRMGFSINKTAQFFALTPEGIRSRRKKIMKTMFSNNHNEEDLNDIIRKF